MDVSEFNTTVITFYRKCRPMLREIERDGKGTKSVDVEAVQSDGCSMRSRSLMSARKKFPRLLHFHQACYVETKQEGLMDSSDLCQILNLRV